MLYNLKTKLISFVGACGTHSYWSILGFEVTVPWCITPPSIKEWHAGCVEVMGEIPEFYPEPEFDESGMIDYTDGYPDTYSFI